MQDSFEHTGRENHHHKRSSHHSESEKSILARKESKRRKKESQRHHMRMMRSRRNELRKIRFRHWLKRMKYRFSSEYFEKLRREKKNIKQRRRQQRQHSVKVWKERLAGIHFSFSIDKFKKRINRRISSFKHDMSVYRTRRRERKNIRKNIKIQLKQRSVILLKYYSSIFSSSFRFKSEYFKFLSLSTLCYILAQLTIYLVYQSVMIIVAHQYNLPTVLYYYKTAFPTPPTSKLWTEYNIINTFASAPVFLLLLGTIIYFVFEKVRSNKNFYKIFILWLYIHSVGYFIGSVISGTITVKYFGWALAWMGALSFLPKLALIPFLALLFIVGFRSISMFIQTAPDYQYIKNLESIRNYLYSTVVFPFILGNIVIFLIKLPELTPYEVLIYFSMVFMIFPFMIQLREYGNFKIAVMNREPKFPLKLSIFTVLVLVIFRIWLGYGILFL
ncbi:MAG: hypothetical protein NTW49_06675 [Bacteroidia bacterium]|nr:hypothetical protein [Bacteroidia bacterium]